MLVSHEVPLKALEKSLEFNDYDYALVHLFKVHKEYYDFYKKSLSNNRTVYLDNSAYELKELYNHQEFAMYCDSLYNINKDNFYYVVPDVIGNKKETIDSFNKFKTIFNKGKKIGVCQGSTFIELLECFKFMKDNVDIIAITHECKLFKQNDMSYSSGLNIMQNMSKNRIYFINLLRELDLLKDTKVHLLGVALPYEVLSYRDIPEIISIDTSSPIVNGILGISYNSMILEKPATKLVDLFDKDLNELCYDNIRQFRALTKI